MKKWIIDNKWIAAPILYVAVAIGGFTAYDEFFADNSSKAAVAMNHGNPSHEQASDSDHEGTSEVNAYVQADADEIKIFLKDKTGNPVNDLEIKHEKLFHFIIVDEQLQKYYHVHPQRTGNGEFRVATPLPEGFYKAFIDIQPKNLAYHVTPVPFIVGSPHGSTDDHHEGLQPDNNLVQTIEGETVKLHLSSTHTNQPVTLTFELDQTNLSPYLGAMGHVVILDENAQTFLHVHPANDQEPIFETEFTQPGIYKIWAEFQQNGKVRAFPFVIEMKGGD